jgi:lysyl-tRNA synthetase class 2
MRRFADVVRRHGWTPAVIGCSEHAAASYQRELGLTALALGDEAVIDVGAFNLDGRAMRGVRQACRRVGRAGYELQVRRVCDIPAAEIAAARVAADSWRTDPRERGYSMALSRVGDPADGHCVLATARQGGTLRGLLHFVPWGPDGLSLDLMRRERSADNGLNEFMIAGVVAGCPDLGVRRLSLNFAVFRDALERGQRVGAGPVAVAWRRALLIASRWWQIDSLYRFNAKFLPQWQPRFVCFPKYRDAPRVTFAALEAEAFVVTPLWLRRWLGRA